MSHRVPVLVPTFNNPTYLRNMLKQLDDLHISEVMVVDSASTSLEMKTLLNSLNQKIEVIRLTSNMGPRYSYQNEEFYDGLPDHFCLTDPDLAFNTKMPPTFLAELIQLSEQFQIGKVGLALDISDTHDMRTDPIHVNGKEYQIWEWERKFWLNQIGITSQNDPVYDATVDTTFALYNKRYFNRDDHEKAIRIAGRYTCRHLPWYRENLLPDSEEHEYRATQQYSYYLGGPRSTTSDQTLNERLQRNLRAASRYGLFLWSGEKLARWIGLTERWKKIKIKIKLKDDR